MLSDVPMSDTRTHHDCELTHTTTSAASTPPSSPSSRHEWTEISLRPSATDRLYSLCHPLGLCAGTAAGTTSGTAEMEVQLRASLRIAFDEFEAFEVDVQRAHAALSKAC